MTNQVAETILGQLAGLFIDLDASILVKSKEWARARVAAIATFKASGKHRNEAGRIVDQYAYYADLFAVAGGKTWYNVFNGRNAAMIDEYMEKNHAATIAARNAMIARKLDKVGVTAIISSDYARSGDGFHGTFAVETDAGRKCIRIETIEAGGWNVQCWHTRTLVKVSK